MKKIILCAFAILFCGSIWAQTVVSAVVGADGFVTIDSKWKIGIKILKNLDDETFGVDIYTEDGKLCSKYTEIESFNYDIASMRIKSCEYIQTKKLVRCEFVVDEYLRSNRFDGVDYKIDAENHAFYVSMAFNPPSKTEPRVYVRKQQ